MPPYTKKKTYRRRTSKKKSYSSHGNAWGRYGYYGLASKALKTAKWVAGLVNAESKYFEQQNTGYTIDYNGAYANLLQPQQGVQASQREGDSIKAKHLQIKGQLIRGSNDENIRFIVVLDKQNDLSSGNDLLQTVGSNLAVFSVKNPNLKYDSKILWDKTFSLTTDSPMKQLRVSIKLNFHTHFNATSTTINTNALKLFVIGQNATGGATLVYQAYCSYIDN